MIDHFTDQIKYSKSCRCDAISTNIFASLLAGLKALSDTKSTIGHEEIKTTTATLIMVIFLIFYINEYIIIVILSKIKPLFSKFIYILTTMLTSSVFCECLDFLLL